MTVAMLFGFVWDSFTASNVHWTDTVADQDAQNAQFSQCAMPYLAVVPGLVIISISSLHTLRLSRLFRQWRPNWTKPFVPELPEEHDEHTLRQNKHTLLWPMALISLSILAFASEMAKLSFPELRLQGILLSFSWLTLILFLALSRPRTCPVPLLAYHFSALVVEVSSIRVWEFPPKFKETAHHVAALAILASILIILAMPMRPVSLPPDSISAVGTTPTHTKRSPEDDLRLWQFLCVSWVDPLITVGKTRQLQEDDVWLLGFEFQTGRLHEKFRQLQGSVVSRLLQANGIDCAILTLISIVQIACDLTPPLLLQQLLLALESPIRRKGVALTYALLLWATRAIFAQASMLTMWYGRRCYERSRGEMIMMVYEKSLSRRVVVGLDKQASPTKDGASIGHGPTNETPKKLNNAGVEMFRLIKDLLFRRKVQKPKRKEPASTGKMFNIIRSDVYQVAQRFYEIDQLVKTPLKFVFLVWILWRLLGPSCFFAVLVVLAAQAINSVLYKLQVAWSQYRKQSTDARLQVNSQYIEALRHLRWYGWQQTWLNQVMEARRHELNARLISVFLNIAIYFNNILASMVFPVVAFFAYTVLAGHDLRIDIIFPAIQLLNYLVAIIRDTPDLVNALINAYVAMERIEDFMAEPEKRPVLVVPWNTSRLSMDACSFSWPGTSTTVLQDVTLVIEPGLTVVYGKVGAGKTVLLQAFLGELEQQSGVSEIPDEMIGYCSQTPWLQSMSIRDNILFYSPYEEQRYREVLDACALVPDLENYRHGDLTLIGENGVGLSGGQRSRVALARALYSRSKILLLDDPLSALDFNTAKSVVQKCFTGDLVQDRTVVLVTHRTDLVVHLATRFIEVSDGQVSTHDSFSRMGSSPRPSEQSSSDTVVPELDDQKGEGKESTPDKMIEDEHREHGGVKAEVWWTFLKAGQRRWWILLTTFLVLVQMSLVTKQWFFKAWGEAYGVSESPRQSFAQAGGQLHVERNPFRRLGKMSSYDWFDPGSYLPSPSENVRPWLAVLLLICICQSVALGAYAATQLLTGYRTSKNLFEQVMIRVTNASLRFYDITPTGRLMNRLTSDITEIDSTISRLGATIVFGTNWAAAFIVVASITPVLLIFCVALMGSFVLIFLRFLPTSRSLRRLGATSVSPLFTNFGELLQGLATVRAFKAQTLFEERVIRTVDLFQGMDHFNYSVQNWLMYRYENLSAMSILSFTVIALWVNLSPGLIAFMLVSANNLVQFTHRLCKGYGDLQMNLVSIERVVELLSIEQEPPGTVIPPASWPKYGSDITFDSVTIRYADHLDPSLTDISVRIPGGSTTAVVGRTGSGKSTLAASLLNIVRAESGVITIDNVALADIDVNTLRHRVTFVPQDPVLFSGTIRRNLDPSNDYSGEECAAVLERVCARQGWTLETAIESGGRNLSHGERQLIGITRAVLRRSSIIILDEATASIDYDTSMELQQILKDQMKDSTVITIAHRVEAVKDADYFIELENGRVSQQGAVRNGRDE